MEWFENDNNDKEGKNKDEQMAGNTTISLTWTYKGYADMLLAIVSE